MSAGPQNLPQIVWSVRSVVFIGLGFLWLEGCSHPSSNRPAGSAHRAAATRPPSPVPSSPAFHPSPAPTEPVKPVPATSPAPSPGSTAAPSRPPARAAVAPPRGVQFVAPNAAPQILAVDVSETTVHPGDRVSGSVLTTSNVASVQARIGGYAMSLDKVGVGRFSLAYTVGPLPWFVRGNFTMRVIAKNARGDVVEREIPLMVR